MRHSTGRPQAARPHAAPRMASVRTILALMLREMATTYGRSPGGSIWVILEPVGGIAMMSVVFSALVQAPPLGVFFPVFYATGMLPFALYGTIQSKVSNALMFSRPLLGFPRVTFLDAILARFALNMMTEAMVAYIVFGGLLTIYDDHVAPDLPVIALSLMLSGLVGLGVGLLNAFLFARFNVWQRGWSILTRPLFLMSCVFFLFANLPEGFQSVLWYNPLVHVVGLMRHGFYPGYDSSYVSVGYVLLFSAATGLAGLILLRRYHRELLAF